MNCLFEHGGSAQTIELRINLKHYARGRPGNRDAGGVGVGGGVGGKSCSEVQVAGRAGLNG